MAFRGQRKHQKRAYILASRNRSRKSTNRLTGKKLLNAKTMLIVCILTILPLSYSLYSGQYGGNVSLSDAFSTETDTQKIVHTVLIDFSDPVSPTQRNLIDRLVNQKMLAESKGGDNMNVLVLTHNRNKPMEWLFHESDSGQEANILFKTPANVEKVRKEKFIVPFMAAVEKAQIPTPRPQTPLIEGLSQLSQHSDFKGGFKDTPSTKRLLIITDGLQHSSYSVYTGSIYSRNGERFTNGYLADLTNTEVIVALIDRPRYKHIQNNRQWEWLKNYLHNSGAFPITRIDIF